MGIDTENNIGDKETKKTSKIISFLKKQGILKKNPEEMKAEDDATLKNLADGLGKAFGVPEKEAPANMRDLLEQKLGDSRHIDKIYSLVSNNKTPLTSEEAGEFVKLCQLTTLPTEEQKGHFAALLRKIAEKALSFEEDKRLFSEILSSTEKPINASLAFSEAVNRIVEYYNEQEKKALQTEEAAQIEDDRTEVARQKELL